MDDDCTKSSLKFAAVLKQFRYLTVVVVSASRNFAGCYSNMRIIITCLLLLLHLSVSFAGSCAGNGHGTLRIDCSAAAPENDMDGQQSPRGGDQEFNDAGEADDAACHRHNLGACLGHITRVSETLLVMPDTRRLPGVSRDIHKPPPDLG